MNQYLPKLTFNKTDMHRNAPVFGLSGRFSVKNKKIFYANGPPPLILENKLSAARRDAGFYPALSDLIRPKIYESRIDSRKGREGRNGIVSD